MNTIVFLFSILGIGFAELVLTPNGYLPAECIKEVPADSFIKKISERDFLVIHPSGKSEFVSACQPQQEEILFKRQDSGWNTYTVDFGQNFTTFNGSFGVPKSPPKYENQTLFYFTSLMDQGEDMIIQPVIQYGPSEAGGAGYWTFANWYVTSSLQAFYSTLFKISAGDTVFGYILLTDGANETGYNYTIGALINGGHKTELHVGGIPVQQSASVTMEVYNVVECSDFPANGKITFTNLVILDNEKPFSPVWQPNIDQSDCKENVKFTPQEVTITWN